MLTNRLSVILLLFFSTSLLAQSSDTVVVNKKRLRTLAIAGGAGYTLTLAGLNHVWYSNSERQSFRFFNDNAEWKQVDKIGHFYSSFYFSDGTSRALQWCGVREEKSDLIGALTGFLVLVPIEIFDGYSDAYGASAGDLVADAAGAAFYLGQKRLWHEVRIHPKFSFHRTDFAPLRPNILGEDFPSELLKDYNGQTYWLSADMDKFMRFPKWLNVAVGYGANGMVFARDQQNRDAGYQNYRQYYLSLDFDLTGIRTRSKTLKALIFLVNMIHLPAPALEFSRKGTRFHGLYF